MNETGLTSAEAADLLTLHGRNELPETRLSSWRIFVSGLIGPMPFMLWAAAIVEMALENYVDGSILFCILFVNATIAWYERIKAGNAVDALKSALVASAEVLRDQKWVKIESALIVPGDIVKLGSGGSVPADCKLHVGTIDVDQSSLTGESLPVTLTEGELAMMGCTVSRGECNATVQKTGAKTYFGQTAALINSASKSGDGGDMNRVILTTMLVLSVASLALCIASSIYLKLKGESYRDALEFAVVVLVASIPLALEVVVTTTLALGATQLSKHGAIVSRLSALEQLAGVDILCSDKTGTLTMNEMQIQQQCVMFANNSIRSSETLAIQDDHPEQQEDCESSQDFLLTHAALATRWREVPRDALDTMVLGAANLMACDAFTQLDYVPFDPAVKVTKATVQRKLDGRVLSVCKGAPHVVINMCNPTHAARTHAMHEVEALGARGIRALAIAIAVHDDVVPNIEAVSNWQLAGLLTFLDPPRPDTKDTVDKAAENGVEVKMLTGDHILIAREMARMLSMGTQILSASTLPKDVDPEDKKLGLRYGNMCLNSNGFAEVNPGHKYMIVEAIRQSGHIVAMTGDGVNDAPALKRADVGIAVEGATDAARAASDIVLTQPGLSTIIDAIIVSRGVFQRMRSFLVYRISATVQLLLFFSIAVFVFRPTKYAPSDEDASVDKLYPTYFHVPVLFLMLITLLNDGCLLTIGYDNVTPSKHPAKWNLPVLFLVAIVMSLVALFSSLLLLHFALASSRDGSVFHMLGLPELHFDQIITLMYLKISISDFLTLFSARTNDKFFFHSMPSLSLCVAATVSLVISSVLASFWPKSMLDSLHIRGLAIGEGNKLMPLYVWAYSLFWWIIQDVVKVLLYKVIGACELFGYVPDNHPPKKGKKKRTVHFDAATFENDYEGDTGSLVGSQRPIYEGLHINKSLIVNLVIISIIVVALVVTRHGSV
eukprot:m.37061 g.37061  ORF g.37061 m.37061 type:complete len:948 (+) comp9237_c0_seq2:248-3091(+)